jgi:hypothetical protein
LWQTSGFKQFILSQVLRSHPKWIRAEGKLSVPAFCSGATDMTVQSHHAVLKYRSLETKGQKEYPLSDDETVIIGRESGCQISLDSDSYQGVSRRHAELIPTKIASGMIRWKVQDLGSVNGTFVNGQRLQEAKVLENGDRVSLGQDGFEFIFESLFDSSEGAVSGSDPLPATVYDRNPKQPPPVSLTPSSKGANHWKLLGGVVGLVVTFLILNASPPPLPQSQTPPASPPARSPAPRSPSGSRPFQKPVSPELVGVEFQGTTLITSHFNVTGEVFDQGETDGEADLYAFRVEAKSTFQGSDVAFIVRFYNAAGNEIGRPERVLYSPSPEQWERGMQGVSGFVLPSDRSDLKVIRFGR